jgi:hypothetical protein
MKTEDQFQRDVRQNELHTTTKSHTTAVQLTARQHKRPTYLPACVTFICIKGVTRPFDIAFRVIEVCGPQMPTGNICRSFLRSCCFHRRGKSTKKKSGPQYRSITLRNVGTFTSRHDATYEKTRIFNASLSGLQISLYATRVAGT